jgi:hypothetical protein
MALPGGYPNMLGPDDSEQIHFAYGSNAERLMVAKKRFDQDDVFSSATALGVRWTAWKLATSHKKIFATASRWYEPNLKHGLHQ